MTLKEQSALSKTTLSPITSDDTAIAVDDANKEELKESKGEDDELKRTESEEAKEEIEPVPEAHEEVRRAKIGRRPDLPTKADIEEHYPLHLHYRSWCEHCVAGKARLAQHRVQPADRERLGITVSAD